MSGSICSVSEVDAARIPMAFIRSSRRRAAISRCQIGLNTQAVDARYAGHASWRHVGYKTRTENFSNLHYRDRATAPSSDFPTATPGSLLTYIECASRTPRAAIWAASRVWATLGPQNNSRFDADY
jgi:hypothetical protein